MSKNRRFSKKKRNRLIRNIIWFAILILVFLLIAVGFRWILSRDSDSIRDEVSHYINEWKGITPTPTSTPTPTPTNTPTPTPTNTPTPTPIAGRIVIDPGHGGSDDGAVSNGVKEKDLALSISHLLKERLEANDYDVFLTRESDDLSGEYDVNNNNRLNPTERVLLINSFDADLVISIHLNSYNTDSSVHGLEILYGDNLVASKELASTLLESVLSSTKTTNRGVKHRNDIVILEQATIPAVLIETGFITNDGDLSNLQDFLYQYKLVQGIINGVDSFMKLH